MFIGDVGFLGRSADLKRDAYYISFNFAVSLPISSNNQLTCKTILLKSIYVKSDVDGFRGNNLGEFVPNLRNNVYSFIYGLGNLYRQDYVAAAERQNLQNMGFTQDMIDKNMICKGLKVSSNRYNIDADTYTYVLTIASPMLVNPSTYLSFNLMYMNEKSQFIKYFTKILCQIPFAALLPNVMVNSIYITDICTVLSVCSNNVYTYDIRYEQNNQNRHFRPQPNWANNANLNAINDMLQTITGIVENVISQSLIVKCFRHYGTTFTPGFFFYDYIDRRLSWVDCSDLFLNFQDATIQNKIRDSVRRVMASRNLANANNLGVTACIEFTRSRAMVGDNFVNPLGVFCSLEEDDFAVITLLTASFFLIYISFYTSGQQDYPVTNTFLSSLLRYICGKERDPLIVPSFSHCNALFSELIARKIVKLDRVSEYFFIEPRDVYSFIYVIPMRLASYNIKWYIKRDFLEFFKFFDSVYFKPRYLRMLTTEGLGILKRLSKFDANVVEALYARNMLVSGAPL
jgi:hypothetical protein